ncbi:MAG: reverse transcriptase family protein [Ruminococcus sp.]|nr:reverse transcriptase family protein [Ruminococcus sp.]
MDGFKIRSKQNFLEDVVKITEDNLNSSLNDKKNAYTKYKKNKKNGIRTIYSIDKNHILYKVQKNMQASFFINFLFPDSVCGFRKEHSYYSFLMPHINNQESRYYLRLDISDFFESIKRKYVEMALDYYFVNEILSDEKNWIIDKIWNIATVDDKIVQGAITSPTLSNLVFRNLDIRIERYCQKLNIIYTRYADDMLFSCDTCYIHRNKFISVIKEIIDSKEFKINSQKTLKFHNELSLNGYVIGENIRLSRSKFKELNKIIYEMRKKTFNGFKNRKDMYLNKNILAGYRAFIIQTLRYIKDDKTVKQLESKIAIIENLISKYCIEYDCLK